MDIWNRSTRIPEIYGTIIFLGLLVYFLVMYAVGLIHVIELRVLNLFIMGTGVYYALKQYRRTHSGELTYFKALVTGTATAALGTATFSLFMFFFLQIEGNLMQNIHENEPLGQYLNPYMASFAVFLEGIFSGLGISYLLVNYLHTDSTSDTLTDSPAKQSEKRTLGNVAQRS
ncbi:MAG TPA: DUF4199 domain-containing protein [Ohtaekwangia sp.]|nr:DUF4199 domain-containing protein [Ohtaekwangia sp.]